jgi:hypothetical protein
MPPKGSVVRSFFASDFICRATPSRAQDSGFSSRNFDLSSFTVSVCPVAVFSGHAARDRGPKASRGCHQSADLTRAQLRFPARVNLLCRSPNAPGFPLVLPGAGSLSDQSVTECWAASVNPVSSGVAFPSIHQLFICRFAVMRLRDFFVSLSPCA